MIFTANFKAFFKQKINRFYLTKLSIKPLLNAINTYLIKFKLKKHVYNIIFYPYFYTFFNQFFIHFYCIKTTKNELF